MRYCGGKTKIADWVLDNVMKHKGDKQVYLEPFVGGGSTFVKIAPHFKKSFAGDTHEDLILMWNAIKDGWLPPAEISEAEYQQLKLEQPSPLRGYVGFNLSRGSKWFGGWARDQRSNRSFSTSGLKALMKDVPVFKTTTAIRQIPYDQWIPGNNWLVYCDPPYKDILQFKNSKSSLTVFDHEKFWSWAEQVSLSGTTVLVSEQEAPSSWEAIAELQRPRSIRSKFKAEKIIERIFKLKE